MKKSTGKPASSQPNTVFKAENYATATLSVEQVTEIKTAFDLFDTDQGGSIDLKELKAAMTSLGFQAKSLTVFNMLSQVDADKSGAIDFPEFLSLMTAKVHDQQTKDGVHKTFVLYDDQGRGGITIEDLRRVASQLAEEVPEDQLQDMMNRADKDGDGFVTEQEFYHIVTKKKFV